eukprot:3432893-Pleurochrysis_carterae.AAC.1
MSSVNMFVDAKGPERVILEGALLAQGLVLLIVIGCRLPRVLSKLAGPPDANLKALDWGPHSQDRLPMWALSVQGIAVLCSLFMLADSAVIVVLLSMQQRSKNAFSIGCWGSATVSWALCALLVLLESRARSLPGRSIRLWWLLNALTHGAHTVRATNLLIDDEELSVSATIVGGALPSLVLALIGLFSPDTPSDADASVHVDTAAADAVQASRLPPAQSVNGDALSEPLFSR